MRVLVGILLLECLFWVLCLLVCDGYGVRCALVVGNTSYTTIIVLFREQTKGGLVVINA